MPHPAIEPPYEVPAPLSPISTFRRFDVSTFPRSDISTFTPTHATEKRPRQRARPLFPYFDVLTFRRFDVSTFRRFGVYGRYLLTLSTWHHDNADLTLLWRSTRTGASCYGQRIYRAPGHPVSGVAERIRHVGHRPPG